MCTYFSKYILGDGEKRPLKPRRYGINRTLTHTAVDTNTYRHKA